MNKQELIKKYEEKYEIIFGFPVIQLNLILEDLRQLDEPQKIQVPQFVVDWYEENKVDFEGNLFRCIDCIPGLYDEEELNDFEELVIDSRTKSFQTLVNMHQFGYVVKKRKAVYSKNENNKSTAIL